MKRISVFLFACSVAATAAPQSFVKDIMPIMNKLGCTSGPCHGGAKGKAGFKLSLRGYDPEFDYRAILHDLSGRRFNRTEPEKSLVLLKPTMGVPHGGGLRFDTDSPYYKQMLAWLSEGAVFGDPVAGTVSKLEVSPNEIFVSKAGASQQMKVVATFADGSQRDVTQLAQYNSSMPQVAEVEDSGEVKTIRKGEAALLIRYEGKLNVTPVTILAGKPGFAWVNPGENNYIDKHVNAKLARLELLPSPLSTDAEFLRRVSFDLIGVPPIPEEIRAFVADKTEVKKKRAAMIDKLMARPEFVNHWSVKWSDLLQVSRTKLGEKGAYAFHEWIKESLAENKPYDKMVRELVTSRGSTFQNPPANFFRFTAEPKVAMETSSQLFLGVRMTCAQCHDHPFEQWTQNQYYQLTAFFGKMAVKNGMDAEEGVVYDKREDFETKHPKDGRIMGPKFLFSNDKYAVRETDLRDSFAQWLTARDNPYFSKAMPNRLWSYFMGKGLIDPVDDIRASNPPSNAALMDALTKDFLDHNFDLRHMIKTIVNSRTYQLSYMTNPWNAEDELNYSHTLPRRLSAEQLFDAIQSATGSRKKFPEVPEESKAQDFVDPHVAKGGFLDLFGRPERQTSCECERRTDVSLVQALNLLNGSMIADSISDPDGRLAKALVKSTSNKDLIEDLYLAALGRLPQAKEFEMANGYFSKGDRGERAQDLMWALLNSNGFLFNQ